MTHKPQVGIMQGRLSNQIGDSIQSFPGVYWKEEFDQASNLGFNTIEWIFDSHKNPLFHSDAISEIISIKKKYGVEINSVCADYFMEHKLFNESENEISKNLKTFENLVTNCAKLGISIIEIPLVDSSSLKTNNGKIQFKNNLEKIFPLIEHLDIDIVLETDLPPNDFRDFLLEINHPQVFANFDSGNSASLGYLPNEELKILKKWIKNIHIKDRKYSGLTVPLGTGDTDFELVFATLREINYCDDLIIQGARIPEKTYSPKDTCLTYLRFVDEYLNKYYK